MKSQPRARGGPARHLLGLLAALLILAWLAAACTPTVPPPATAGAGSTAPANPTAAKAGATIAPAVTSIPAGTPVLSQPAAPTAGKPAADLSKLPTGVDADGNFYRGDPNAAVKLVDFSDFQ